MDSEGHACPVCGQPVETVVKRHKTLGAWVPVWGPGPCRNPGCATYKESGPRAAGQQRSAGAEARPGGGSGPQGPPVAGTGNSAV
ncbi:hypothetical protein HKX69_11395 [Streptomyces argyrophyllae]|uniref:Uncharacterized protein n=1 Tax=Streptomyces argyrophylli TaxID=2726118 RepID=A0A6M4PGE1_9ACTN|nr:hypothetical protein [Streptomyces argyrophyllae]QJS10051.1 hypothetical protein HKX69_11395 [Streptomyces argyrophyllae]